MILLKQQTNYLFFAITKKKVVLAVYFAPEQKHLNNKFSIVFFSSS